MDGKGLIGMPIRLAIAFLILALAVPLLVGMTEDLRDEVKSSELSIQAGKVSDTAKKAYYAGAGSVFTVEISIDHHCMLIIGGTGSDAYSIRMMSDGDEIGKMFMEGTVVKFMDEVSVSGAQTLMLECVKNGHGNAVEVTVL